MLGGKIQETFLIFRSTFRYISNRIGPFLARETVTKDPISPELRLALCLYRLGHGDYLYTLAEMAGVGVYTVSGVHGWRSGESTRLLSMWPGFDSQIQRHMWVEFVGFLLCTERFSPGTPVSPLLKNQHLT